MQPPQRFPDAGQFPRFEPVGRNSVGHELKVRLDGGPHDSPDFVHLQAFGQPVTRQHVDRRRVLVVELQPLRERVRKFPAALITFRLSGKQHDVFHLKLLEHPRLVEPHATDKVPSAAEQHGRHGAAVLQRPRVGIDDCPADSLREAGFER